MLLTNCAACAAPLAHDAPRCIRCHTRYCNKTCQHDHWRRGHKQMCKKIHRGGNAEQYYADKKYKEAVAVAVEACADDTKVQLDGNDDEGTLREAGNVTECLVKLNKLGEAEDFLNDVMPIAERSLGCEHTWTLILRMWYGKLLCRKADASAIDILEDTVRRSNRVLGPNHPDSKQIQEALDDARAKLAALDSS